MPLVADVSTEAGAAAFVRDAREALGGVDILVYNGGGPPPGNFTSTAPEAYRAAIELNCLTGIAMCSEAVPAMREQQWGRVLAITSVGVRQPIAGLILSNVARSGLTGFLKTLAREVAGDGVTVNSLQPGLHDTARIRELYGGELDARGRRHPGGRGGPARGFRPGRGIPVLRGGVVRHRHGHPDRRRRVHRAPLNRSRTIPAWVTSASIAILQRGS